MRRSLGAIAVVAAGGAIALAAGGSGGVSPAPPVVVLRPAAGSGSSATVTLTNTGSASVALGELVPDGTCAAGVTTAAGATLPLTLGAGSAHAVTVACAAQTASTIRRCQFHARTTAHAALADYTALCVPPPQAALALAPAGGAAFGEVPIGTQVTLPITLTNPSGAAITAEAIDVADQAGDFQIGSPCATDGPGCLAGEPIAAGSALTFDLRCAPTQLGARTTQLFVVTSNGGAIGPYAVTCTGVAGAPGPSLALDLTSIDLGGVPVGSGSASGTFHVTNIGTSDLHITAIALTAGALGDWTVAAGAPCAQTPCTLAAGAAIAVEVVFDPTALYGRHATLELRSDDASHPSRTVTLDGTGLGATLALGTAVGSGVDFGSVAIGGTASATLALRDDGNAPLPGVTLALQQDSTAFAVAPDTLALPASGELPVAVTCAPPAALTYTGALTIAGSGALTGSPIVIPLTCTGTTGSLVATPNPVALGEIRTGSGVQTTSVTLATLGPQVAITAAPALVSPLGALTLGELSSTTVTAASPATFTVAVDPQADGPLTDRISLATDSQVLDLPVTGRIVTAAVTASAAHDLGSFCVGEPTAAATVSLTASGTASIGLPAPPVMAQGATSPFSLAPIAPSQFPYTVLAGARATAQVTAKRQRAAGTVSDDVVWSDDVAGAPAPHTTISAHFIDDGGAIAPGSVDFGAAPIHLTDPTSQIITLQNCSTEAMTLAAPVISPSGQFFTIGAPPQQLLPGQAATFAVGFGPVTVGALDATLTVHATLGTSMPVLTVELHGVGEITAPGGADAGPGTQPAPSGCGCGAGPDPASGAAALAALGALRRRRRGRAFRLRWW